MRLSTIISGLFLGSGLLGLTPGIARSEALPASYQTYQEMTRELRAMAKSDRDLVRLHELAESSQGRNVWLVEMGHGDDDSRKTRPALLLVAGIEGDDLTGSASAVHWLHGLTRQFQDEEDMKSLLKSVTIYVVPRLNPDALETYFKKPRLESAKNFDPVDDDHDGEMDEDGAEDINKDDLVTWMRIEDPSGDYILDPTDARILIKADPVKGEKGAWRLLREGIDNDQDEQWNEDGPGGINFNRNFPYGYRYFGVDAGRHPVSQPETRALADFVVQHPNIGITFIFGRADNLLKTPKGESEVRRPPVAMQESDISILRKLGEEWRENLGLEKELGGNSENGTFSDWIYFHRGRLSLAAQAWSEELALAGVATKTTAAKDSDSPKEDTPKEEKQEAPPDAKAEAKVEDTEKNKPDSRSEKERDFLHWTQTNAPNAFVAWSPFVHPDFPGQRVEIGGWAPFSKSTAPPLLLTNLVQQHANFLTALAGKLPRIAIQDVEVKSLGKSIFDITAKIENTGYLPTALAQGETTREVYPTRVTLEIADDLLLGGTKRVFLNNLSGSGGMQKVRWVCRLPNQSRVEMSVVSMLGGKLIHSIELKGEQ